MNPNAIVIMWSFTLLMGGAIAIASPILIAPVMVLIVLYTVMAIRD